MENIETTRKKNKQIRTQKIRNQRRNKDKKIIIKIDRKT